MNSVEKIRELLVPIAEAHEIVINDLLWRNEGSHRILEIPIMFHDKSMDLETSSKMSGLFLEALECSLGSDLPYDLDVCSPGAERKLNSHAEIEDEIGSHVYVKFKNPFDGRHEIYGTLSSVDEDHIKIEYLEKTRKVNLDVATDNIGLIRLAIKF